MFAHLNYFINIKKINNANYLYIANNLPVTYQWLFSAEK